MSTSVPLTDSRPLQQVAVERARSAFASLKGTDNLFSQVQDQNNAISDILGALQRKYESHGRKRRAILETFERYTQWLQNFSGIIDVVVQTQAGIGCPIWAPLKLVLQTSAWRSDVAKHIIDMIQTISGQLPRLAIYEKLMHHDITLQTALLDLYSEVLGFSIRILQFVKGRVLVRLGRLVATFQKKDIEDTQQRLLQHARRVDHTAMAIELERAEAFRQEQHVKEKMDLKLKCCLWLKAVNTTELLHRSLSQKTPQTCEWIYQHPVYSKWTRVADESNAIDRILLISGKPGCGKSVLASSLVDSTKRRVKQVLYFAFSATDADRQTLVSLVRALLWQLLQTFDSGDAFKIVETLMFNGSPRVDDLWAAVSQLTALREERRCWVIDGLDECQEPVATLFQPIIDLLDKHKSLRVILFGRQYAVKVHPLDSVDSFDNTFLRHTLSLIIAAR